MGFLIRFFLRNGVASRRTLLLGILALMPVLLAILIRIIAPAMREHEGVGPFGLYPDFGLILYLHFLVPVMALFVGTAVITDEVEERTLPYLLTRPIPRRNIVLAKLIAAMITIGALLVVSHLLTFAVLLGDPDSGGLSSNLTRFLHIAGVMLLGVAAYLGIFTLAGGVLKRSVIIGLLFVFGWENLIAFFPGNVKLFTVAHYLHLLYPGSVRGDAQDSLAMFVETLSPAGQVSDLGALLTLIGITFVFATLACTLLYFKEYRLEQTE